MLQIHCPYCDEIREEEEFHYAGEAHIVRPTDPDLMTDEEWGKYLFHRKNNKGSHTEMWYHSAGCHKYFNVTRHTVTNEIEEVYKMGNRSASLSQKEEQNG
ncbi:sarcosine oxidase subunit delta [Vibrio pectenicida]|uniref:Sarcosine oxidase subunit delta n=1 Tax=Vibrio pectenicida TaxID=62763 RepID=A0A7Y3ZYR8_9VIBR|nr:sarcosine oxidase subunit delta [Vibrio pectenicida]NOH70664.1 sarcosine oxidase subunit delta [Vibrio pectenicida]